MQINMKNCTIRKQVLNENSETSFQLNAHDWEELERCIDVKKSSETEADGDLKLTQELETIVKKRDQEGLRGFIQRNKDNFFTNILSGTVSAGLLALLKMLIG